MTIQLRQSITEVLDILQHIEKSSSDKIPEKLMKFFMKNRLNTYNPKLDYSKKLSEMELSLNTKNILGIIYYKYWCDNSQKTKFIEKIKTNEIEYKPQ